MNSTVSPTPTITPVSTLTLTSTSTPTSSVSQSPTQSPKSTVTPTPSTSPVGQVQPYSESDYYSSADENYYSKVFDEANRAVLSLISIILSCVCFLGCLCCFIIVIFLVYIRGYKIKLRSSYFVIIPRKADDSQFDS